MNTLQQEQLKLLNGLADNMPIEMNAGQLRALLATARAEGAAEERERIVQIINNHKYGSPKSCDESYWYTRGDRLIKSQVYFEALTDVLEALTTKEIDHAEE